MLNQLTFVALAAAPTTRVVTATHIRSHAPVSAVCADSADAARCTAQDQTADTQLSIPAGARQCPGSGPGASCSGFNDSTPVVAGVSSTPDGQAPCPVPTGSNAPTTPAACNDTVLPPVPPVNPATSGASIGSPLVTPSVPIASLQVAGQPQRVGLSASASTVAPGQSAILTATASTTLTGTSNTIEIFDQSAGTMAGACMQSSQCVVAYAAKSGVHTFVAFITPPTNRMPIGGPTVSSGVVSVAWLGVTFASSSTVVAPGKPVTFTATSSVDVAKAGRSMVIYDNTTKSRLTYCSRGTTCSTTLSLAGGGAHELVGWIPGQPEAFSRAISVTWLKVDLAANTTYPLVGGTVYLKATANVDLAGTPWSLGVYDQQGHLVDQACKSGNTCAAQVTLTTGVTPAYTAVIGSVSPLKAEGVLGQLLRKVSGPTSLVNIQAHSDTVQPTRMLWGVDSCKAFTSTPNAADGLYPQVVGAYGAPDFWGRYLTNTVCPGISPTEVAAAAFRHMGILPIYNDYSCSAVSGYGVGKQYAGEATAAATSLGIPQGRVLAIDIEPPGDACPGAANVDAGFVQGWFDGVFGAGYIPTYYGNGTAGSEFGSAWCAAVAAQPAVGTYSYLWSFEPSLLGSYTKASAPNYSPNQTGCPGRMAAWQYELSAGSNPDVDTDEALSRLPLWFP